MGRTVDTTLQAYLDAPSCKTQTCLIVELVSGEVINITTSRKTLFVTITGDEFAPDLRKVGEINQSAFANVDRCQVTAQNVDKVLGSRILAGDLSKARCAVARVYQDDYDKTATQSFVELFSGEFKPSEVLPDVVNFEIVDDLVAAGYSVSDWSLADNCPFVYKDPLTCACDDPSTTCGKTRFGANGCASKVRSDGKDQTAWFGGMEAAEESNSAAPGSGDGGGDPPFCFGGEVAVVMASGEQILFETLYENREARVGEKVKCFDSENNIHEREILGVFKSVHYKLAHVRFTGEKRVLRVVKDHRFWTENGFVAIRDLTIGDKVFTDNFDFAEIELIETVDYTDGAAVYNLLVDEFHSYFAVNFGGAPKAVSNSKPIYEG